MIDFGLSKHFTMGDVLHDIVGTPYSVAPEVISGSYDEKCDIWAVGVIAFLLLCGDPPFGGLDADDNLFAVREAILSGDYDFEPSETWSLVSQHAKDFVKSLLVIDPSKRPTAREALQHEWLHDWDKRDLSLSPKVVTSLVAFKELSSMKKLFCQVLSFTLLPEQIQDLHKEFAKLDKDGKGEMTEGELRDVLMKNLPDREFSESEFQDIFYALRLNKKSKVVRWHEFIAAELPQCQVDDRNLRLAFEHLDVDHDGYITFENLVSIMGTDAQLELSELRQMWHTSLIECCKCESARITYGDFERLLTRV